MKNTTRIVSGSALATLLLPLAVAAETADANVASATTTESLQQQLDDLQYDYDYRLSRLEKRLKETQKATRTIKANTFNPAISLILNGNAAAYKNNPGDYQLPGFALGGEAGLTPEGFSLGESEITLSSNVDQQFYGQATFSMADDAGETSIGTEEAFFETLALPAGLKIKAGRFFSAIGYINGKHAHAWAFGDAPLVYRGLFGNQLKQDGVQFSWLVPTDTYLLIGGEAGNGVHYPAAGPRAGIGDWSAYIKTGGDIGLSHSWQLGLSHWRANKIQGRGSQGVNSPSFDGKSRIYGIDLVYKWAPDGNTQQRNLRLQAEYFRRSEDGTVNLNNAQNSPYSGDQSGWYAQAVYQFVQQWSVGLRYDRISSSNSGSDPAVLAAAGLSNAGNAPKRSSVMVSWRPSEFSHLRLQYNRDDSTSKSDNQLLLQYTMVMGAHGAHAY
ncbi:MAG TPA: hypothetical protein ENK06_12015 [Gammaproteobacteria bacterium]|nr:hypothetical protein [Gammaproteobacteria bacterium]